ncbi:MAG: cysteine--tRNA ligase [Nitrospirota bacterium]|nr:cysteine--tRNA ligase [Nitrospirota bacterium]
MRGRPLVLFNSMGRQPETFAPVHPGQARIYSCGPTVYNYAHLGNLRAYVFTDSLRRALMFKGLDVTQVMNITDVGHLTSDADVGDDKMEKAAAREHKTVWDIARYYTDAFHADVRNLGILPPDHEPKATDYIQQMIAFARKLEADGHTYTIGDGLYFDTHSVADYGKLGCLDVAGQEAGARVEMVEGKRHATDFCLWKKSPADSKRLMEWDSPWGTGAPGWHLECSVMSIDLLDAPFDIHTGGIDHRQVHHVNEVAQNQGFTGHAHSGANFWLHNEFLVLGEDKMSKSRGGFLRLQTLIDQGIHPLVYRYFCLQAHYRKPLVFGWDALVAARAGLKRLLLRVATLQDKGPEADTLSASLDDLLHKLEDGPPPPDETARLVGAALETFSNPVLIRGNTAPLFALIAHTNRLAANGGFPGADVSRLFQLAAEKLTGHLSPAARPWLDKLDEAVSDDLNTPQALAHLNELVADKRLSAADTLGLATLYDLVLGLQLLTLTAEDLVIRPVTIALSDEDIQKRIIERNAARRAKDFNRSDAIRDELIAEGVSLMDGPEGTTWEWLPKG